MRKESDIHKFTSLDISPDALKRALPKILDLWAFHL